MLKFSSLSIIGLELIVEPTLEAFLSFLQAH